MKIFGLWVRRSWGKLAGLAIITLTATSALRRLDDFDSWWHLAAGRWISAHRAFPATDTLSHTVRDHRWIDLQWGFDLGVYALHAAGGPAALCVAAAFGFTLAIGLILRLVRPHVGDTGGALLMLAVVLAAQDRFAVRPEMVSFPLLALLITILDYGRTRDGRGSWLLVPLMLVWVNVHALFIVGAFAIACALAGSLAAPSRRLRVWGLASLATVLVNPYGLRGALFPLKLLSRIDGSNPAFQTIAEFRSPFATDAAGVAMTAYKILLVVGVGAALGSVVVRAFDYGGLLFFAGLCALSLAARRNAALFAVGSAPFVARSLGFVLASLRPKVRGVLLAVAPWLAGTVACAALFLGASVVTGAFYRYDRQPRESGWGVLEGTFPIRAAAFAREAKLPGRLYNDIAAGGYLAWDDPIGDGVFIDGRLEVYDTAFFAEYINAMYDPVRFEADADRFGVQTVILFHRWENRRLLVARLARGGVWSLVYADEVAAVFVRARGNEDALARAAAIADRWNQTTRAWLNRPVGRWLYPAGRVEGTHAFARLLATLDDPEGAVEAYTTLLTLPIPAGDEVEVRLLLARRFSATGRAELAREQARRILAIVPGNLEAQRLLP